jgi:acetyl-CoA carboxylase biotin carboxyl carrier protein
MDWKQLKELIELVSEKGFTEFEVERQGFRLRISNAMTSAAAARGGSRAVSSAGEESALSVEGEPAVESETVAAPRTPSPPAKPGARTPPEGPSLHLIRSPIVGTFYRSPSPTSDPFVKVGDRVDGDTVVCVIEAMKLMNEIQAEITGEVVEIYVENAQPVEYDQPLFGLKLN